jgi:alpha-D-xyloside xylohydrolase
VYPGADGDFTLYNDDGKTYAYEHGDATVTRLHWDDSARRFTGADQDIVEVIR